MSLTQSIYYIRELAGYGLAAHLIPLGEGGAAEWIKALHLMEKMVNPRPGQSLESKAVRVVQACVVQSGMFSSIELHLQLNI